MDLWQNALRIFCEADDSNRTVELYNSGTGKVYLSADSLGGEGNRAVYSDSSGYLTNTSSDERMKTNVEPLTDSLDVLGTIAEMRGVYFNWSDFKPDGAEKTARDRLGSQREIGLIAQEVQTVLPEVIGVNADGMLSLDYPRLVAVLIEGVKELTRRIETLEEQLRTGQ